MVQTLYIIPTPIGNLDDMTLRSIEVLKNTDWLFCEDTRTSSFLLKHFDIRVEKLIALNKINEYHTIQKVLEGFRLHKRIGLVSDAGTPLISDPGSQLVKSLIEHNIQIQTLPGASALIPALCNSGFDLSSFLFLGFPPHKKGRQTFIKSLNDYPQTIVLYESPHRLIKFLEEYKLFIENPRRISISREISKLYETTIRGNVDEILAHFTAAPPRGEIVICIEESR
ncbi:MAG: 16S rRNA (cytidine(1402)-2'-O)-methyltransferase [Chitinophagales bacterium]|jgi:16S rRNA (cytidine1402-2'-O)-methyltransferase|nr:16S rRNA (cytidine(1402)-2'-O)-methyltransferase [Chitinophagales bacterium]